MRRSGGIAAVASIDLDHLKAVNDRYGHAAGDRFIREAASVLSHHARAGDAVARVGGDEFLVLLSDADAHAARAYADRIRRAVRTWRYEEHGYGMGFCVGWAACTEAGGLEAAVRLADKRMYARKRARARTVAGSAGVGGRAS